MHATSIGFCKKKEIDEKILNEALKDYTDDQKEMISADTIMDIVCEYFNISKADIIGKKKNKRS